MAVKAVKASINVPNVSYMTSTILWYAKKEKHLHKISKFTLKLFSPGLSNLAAQIRCAQNWYIAVQIDPKYSQLREEQ